MEKQKEQTKDKVLHIEIAKSVYVKGKWNIRIGNILGSTEHSNITFEEILMEVRNAMNELELKNDKIKSKFKSIKRY